MAKLKIDPEFVALMPALSDAEYQELEDSVKKEGCRDALVTWKGVILDGHNRYAICKEHGIKFKTTEMEFKDRSSAKIWILNNQFARRNLNNYQRAELALKLKPLIEEQAKEKLSTHTKEGYQKSDKAVHTAKELGNIAGISHDTIHKVERIERIGSEKLKNDLRNGKISINRVYTKILEDEYLAKLKEETKIKERSLKELLSGKKYRIIYADPPWDYSRAAPEECQFVKYDYMPLTIEELCEFPIKEIAEKDAILFLWVPTQLMPHAFEVMRAWGFQYKTNFVWLWMKNFGYGSFTNFAFQPLFIATKGSHITPDTNRLYKSVAYIKRVNDSSEKPEYFRKMLDIMYTYGDRIEIFARKNLKKKFPTWDFWGCEYRNNLPKNLKNETKIKEEQK